MPSFLSNIQHESIFKYNGKAKYSAKNFKGGYTNNNFQV